MADQARYGDQERVDIGNEHALAASAARLVSLPLGMWAGRGDWAKFSQDARDKAGRRALIELDEAITSLAAVREKLALAVGLPSESPVGEDRG